MLIAGDGFIGRHLMSALPQHPIDVAMGTEHDLFDVLDEVDPEAIVWAAGFRSADAQVCQAGHVHAPLRAFEAAKSLRRFVYLSSGEVYGSQEVPFTESQPLLGESPYARAKIAGEVELAQRAQERRVALDVLRLSVVYGPGQTGNMLVPALIAQLLRNERFAMTGGEQTRDFIFVSDVCELVACCLAEEAPTGIFNASGGVEMSIEEAARTVAGAVSSVASSQLDIGALPYRENEQMRYALDATHARETFGWLPNVDFQTGVELVVQDARRAAHRADWSRGSTTR